MIQVRFISNTQCLPCHKRCKSSCAVVDKIWLYRHLMGDIPKLHKKLFVRMFMCKDACVQLLQLSNVVAKVFPVLSILQVQHILNKVCKFHDINDISGKLHRAFGDNLTRPQCGLLKNFNQIAYFYELGSMDTIDGGFDYDGATCTIQGSSRV